MRNRLYYPKERIEKMIKYVEVNFYDVHWSVHEELAFCLLAIEDDVKISEALIYGRWEDDGGQINT